MIAQLVKFAVGGGMGTVCHYFLLMAMVNRGVPPLADTGDGQVLAAGIRRG